MKIPKFDKETRQWFYHNTLMGRGKTYRQFYRAWWQAIYRDEQTDLIQFAIMKQEELRAQRKTINSNISEYAKQQEHGN